MVQYTDINHALPDLAAYVMDGDEVGSRNGRVMERTHIQVQLLKPWRREILVPSRKASLPAQIAETMWILAGRNDVEWLSHYLPRAKEFSDDGVTWRGGYGPRLREWSPAAGYTEPVDQIAEVVEKLKKNPLDRRAVIQIFDPAVDNVDSKDIPCNNWIHFLSRKGELHMHVAVRSNDLMWGFSGINAFEWSAVQEVVAGLLGIGIGPLTFSISSLHLYDRHWKKADRLRTERGVTVCDEAPRLNLKEAEVDDLAGFDALVRLWFEVEQLIREDDLRAEEAISSFPEPMLRSWLRVLDWYWHPRSAPFERIPAGALRVAADLGPVPMPWKESGTVSPKEKFESEAYSLAQKLDVPEHQLVEGWSRDGVVFKGDADSTRHYIEFEIEPQIPEVFRKGEATPEPLRKLRPPFADYVVELHNEKDAAYGDSWKRRGEMIGIMANIARKIDRLGVSDSQETAADTAIDLLVYLAKYRWWLVEFADSPAPIQLTLDTETKGLTDITDPVNILIHRLRNNYRNDRVQHTLETKLRRDFDSLENSVLNHHDSRFTIVDHMLRDAFDLAGKLYWKQRNENRSWNPEQ